MIAASAAVLAGGDSKRMGWNKALLKMGNFTLIEIIVEKLSLIFTEIIIVTHLKEQLQCLDLKKARFVEDSPIGNKKSALRGIHAALKTSKKDKVFIVACDMPFINPLLISFMSWFIEDYDIVIPKEGEHFQPLHGYYGKACAPVIEEMFTRQCFKISELYDRVKVKTVDEAQLELFDPDGSVFFNINNSDDYKLALKLYKNSNLLKGALDYAYTGASR